MDTIGELSDQLSLEHPELDEAVSKIFKEISDLYYGVNTHLTNKNGRPFLSRDVMKAANLKRIDHTEFFMAYFKPELRAAFLIKLSMEFRKMQEVWYYQHHSKADTLFSADSDKGQITYLNHLFTKWIDDALPLVMEDKYQCMGGWF